MERRRNGWTVTAPATISNNTAEDTNARIGPHKVQVFNGVCIMLYISSIDSNISTDLHVRPETERKRDGYPLNLQLLAWPRYTQRGPDSLRGFLAHQKASSLQQSRSFQHADDPFQGLSLV